MRLGQLLNFNFDFDTAPYTPSLCWIVLYLFALNFPEAGFSADIFQQNIIYQKVVIFPLRPVTFPGVYIIRRHTFFWMLPYLRRQRLRVMLKLKILVAHACPTYVVVCRQFIHTWARATDDGF